MKRERYFQDELWRMFVTYAILPAALFTFICGVLFMTVLLHGRERANREYLSYVNGRVNQMVESCEQGIETLAELTIRLDYITGKRLLRPNRRTRHRRGRNTGRSLYF